jgi:putative Mn2+ efflux pump MntP
MTAIEILLLAVGLAMDCFAVSIAGGILLKRMEWRPVLLMTLSFGLFQALMPLLGWLVAGTFSHLIGSIDHWLAFSILAFLGGRMILESFRKEESRHPYNYRKPQIILMLAVATSIDALAVGVSFAFLGFTHFSQILPSITTIGVVSALASFIGLLIGTCCGYGVAKHLRAELWGGLILVAIGTKILIEHLLLNR